MNRQEKEKLAELVGGLLEISYLIDTPSADILVEKIYETDDKNILDILIEHLEYIRPFVLYSCFDREASVRDINKLLEIIHQLQGKGN